MYEEFPDMNYSIDEEEFNADVEAQKIMLEKAYDDRKKYREEQNKKLEKVEVTKSDDMLEEIEKKAEYNTKMFLPDKYMFCYKLGIIENETLGKCSLHYILGGLLRHKRIYKSPYSWLDYRIHLILFQVAGSGKGMTANFIERVTKAIKYPMKDIETDEILTHDSWREPQIMKDGQVSSETFINSYEINKKTGEIKKDKDGILSINKGTLALKDFIIYEEGGTFFSHARDSVDKVNYFLQAMESIGSSNNVIEKKLVSYKDSLKTTSKTSLFIMTRPIGKIQKKVAESGFFQRCLFIPKDIPFHVLNDLRINSGLNDLDFMGGNYNEKNYTYYNEMIDEFIKVIEFGFNNEIVINPKQVDTIKSFYKTKMLWFYEDMMETVNNDDFKSILSSLENRYKDNMYKLAFHSAVMRYSKYVDLEDFQYAFNLIRELYFEQKKWLYESIEIDYYKKKENIDFNKILINHIKIDRNGLKSIDDHIKQLSIDTNMEIYTITKKIDRLTEGNMSLIEKYNRNGKVHLKLR